MRFRPFGVGGQLGKSLCRLFAEPFFLSPYYPCCLQNLASPAEHADVPPISSGVDFAEGWWLRNFNHTCEAILAHQTQALIRIGSQPRSSSRRRPYCPRRKWGWVCLLMYYYIRTDHSLMIQQNYITEMYRRIECVSSRRNLTVGQVSIKLHPNISQIIR